MAASLTQTSSDDPNLSALQQVIEELLQDLDPQAARAIRVGAIPHWVDHELWRLLNPNYWNQREIWNQLVRFRFAKPDVYGSLRYRDDVRTLLLAQTGSDFQPASKIAQEYFKRKAGESPANERPTLEREALYHLLSVDEPAGLRLLNKKVEQACYFRQIGSAESWVGQAVEIHDKLSKDGKMWVRYFQACLVLQENKDDSGESIFYVLTRRATDQTLKALAHWKLGQARVGQQRWADAVYLYKNGLSILRGMGETQYQARIQMSLGDVYRDLAERSSGDIPAQAKRGDAVGRTWKVLRSIPFLALESLGRRLEFMPRLYFGVNYKEWIIAHLLYIAADWYQKAERSFTAHDSPLELAEARLALAEVEHQAGRWAKAQARYRLLEDSPVIRQSPYRRAKVLLGQGCADLQEGKLEQALRKLNEASRVFQGYGDSASNGQTAFLLGQVYMRQKDIQKAGQAYLQSAEEYRKAQDALALTRMIWRLENLQKKHTLPPELDAAVTSLSAGTAERHTLARFPEKIMRLFRKLTIYLAVPFSYAMTVFTTIIVAFVFVALEATLLKGISPLATTSLSLVLVVLSIPLIPFWFYRAIYGIFGIIVVQFFIGRKLALIEEEQPLRLVLNDGGVTCYSVQSSKTGNPDAPQPMMQMAQRLAWPEITDFIQADFKIRSTTVSILSRSFLKTDTQTLTVEGITSDYAFFKDAIEKRLTEQKPPLATHKRDFIFLETRWTLAVIGFCLALITYLYAIKQIGTTADGNPLAVSTIVIFMVLTVSLVFPATILWRLWLHIRHLRKEVGPRARFMPTSVLLIAAILASVAAATWILLITFGH
jgi:tetratricopeptide (TPR) repeat protein